MKHALSFKVFPNMLATFGLGGVFFNASLMSVFGVVFSLLLYRTHTYVVASLCGALLEKVYFQFSDGCDWCNSLCYAI